MTWRLTNFEPCGTTVPDSGFRRRWEKDIDHETWCEREARRLRAKGVPASVAYDGRGNCAVEIAAEEETP